MADENDPYKSFAKQVREEAEAQSEKEKTERERREKQHDDSFNLAAQPLNEVFIPEVQKAAASTKGEFEWQIESFTNPRGELFSRELRGKPHIVISTHIPGSYGSGKILIFTEHGDAVKVMAPDKMAQAGKPQYKDVSSDFGFNTFQSATQERVQRLLFAMMAKCHKSTPW